MSDSLKKAQEIIATRARAAGEETFAREVMAGAWDHENRSDIAAVKRQIEQGTIK